MTNSSEPSQLDVRQARSEDTAVLSDPDAIRVLFIGNSITRHGVSERTRLELGWDHVSGMAASDERTDYAHVLAGLIERHANAAQGAMRWRKVFLFFHDGGGGGSIAQRLSAIDEVFWVKPHIVIVQLGEHEIEVCDIPTLTANYDSLVTAFSRQSPPPAVVCTGLWDPDEKPPRYAGWRSVVENTMRDVCLRRGIPFVSVESLAFDPTCRGAGTHPGVRWHPNDKGHAGYAHGIHQALARHSGCKAIFQQ